MKKEFPEPELYDWNAGKESGMQERNLECRKGIWNAGREAGMRERKPECRKESWNAGKETGIQEGKLERRIRTGMEE